MTTTVEAQPTEAPATQAQPARKRALITGASSGIGEEFARQLAERGNDLILVARRKDRMETIATEIKAANPVNIEIIEADLSTAEGVAATRARIDQGDISLLVNNAGFGINGVFGETPLERELEELDLNIRALTILSYAAIQQMKPKRTGTIINVGSTGSYQPVPYMSTYAATKAYVLYFSEGLHEEAKQYGVTVTCLCPGGTRTEFMGVAKFDQAKMPRAGWMSTKPVVKTALDAAKAGRAIAVPGMTNKAMANVHRVLPRFAVRKIAGGMFKRLISKEANGK